VFYQSTNVVTQRDLANDFLAALTTRPAAALMTTPTVHLFTNQFQPNSLTPLVEFVEASFVGYADVALPALVGPVTGPSSQQELMCDVNFIAGAVVSPGQLVYGYWIDNGYPSVWYYAEAFPTPFPFAVLGNFLDLKIVLPQPTYENTM
jgi:hypothetical protein